MKKIWIIQAYNDELKTWLNCYKINNFKDALEHKNYMDKEYPRKHRLISVFLTK